MSMTGSDSWHVDPATHGLLTHVESLGYVVSVHRLPSSRLGTVGASVEMHAVRLGTPPEVHVARVVGLRRAARCAEWRRTAPGPFISSEDRTHQGRRGSRSCLSALAKSDSFSRLLS